MQIDQSIIIFIQVLYANRHFCIKNLDENNYVLGLDTSELRFRGVQKLVLELETRPRTEAFIIHVSSLCTFRCRAEGRCSTSMTSHYKRAHRFSKQECIPVGCVPSATVAVCWGGACSRGGGSAPGGCACSGGGVCSCSLGGGFWSRGVGVVSQHALRQNPPPHGQTDTCKNITFATSLRTLIIIVIYKILARGVNIFS